MTRTVGKGVGGAEGNRTPDLRSAIAALSHLSYGPNEAGIMRTRARPVKRPCAALARLLSPRYLLGSVSLDIRKADDGP